MLDRVSTGPRRVRTLFLSDIHLGTRGCQADKLLDFLRHYEAETIYLVGDIVDGWQLRSAWYWPQLHNDVVQKLLRQARKGVRLFYIPGNHDEFLRDYYGTHFGGIEVLEDAVHVAADGKRYLIVHGDLFDVIIRHARWLALLGSNAYDLAIWINTYFNAIRRAFGLTYWSLSKWAKLKVKNAMAFIGEYERTLAAEARRRGGLDGVVCGHIHHAVIRDDLGLRYINCGDWVESCTAVVEHFNGQFEIVRWIGGGPLTHEQDFAAALASPASEHADATTASACPKRIHGSRISGSPTRIVAFSRTFSCSEKPSGAKTMMVDPCWNQPISSPFLNVASQAMTLGPRCLRPSSTSRKCRRMLATSTAATGTSVMVWPLAVSLVRNSARSFLQNSFSTRRNAIGLTFQVSPEM